MAWAWRKAALMAVCNIWSLALIIVSGLVSSGFADFGMFTCFARYFPARSCSAMCSNHLRLTRIRSRFPPWKIFHSSVIPSFFTSLDWMHWYATMSACGPVIMSMIFRYFASALGFSSRIRSAAGSPNSGRRSRTFLILSSIHRRTNEVPPRKFLWWFHWDRTNRGLSSWIGPDSHREFPLGI